MTNLEKENQILRNQTFQLEKIIFKANDFAYRNTKAFLPKLRNNPKKAIELFNDLQALSLFNLTDGIKIIRLDGKLETELRLDSILEKHNLI